MKFLFFLFLFTILSFKTLFPLDEKSKEIFDFVHEVFNNAEFILQSIPLKSDWKIEIKNSGREQFLSDKIFGSFIKLDGKKVGYILIDKAMGKTEQFTVAVLYSLSGKIVKVRVFDDPSPHKQKLNRPDWIKQFTGKDKSSRLLPGRDIDGISGSTFSVKGLASSIWRLNKIYPEVLDFLK